ncbi:MAG: hypothetical protein AAFQ84_09280 [Pseudomonadota bacterium]
MPDFDATKAIYDRACAAAGIERKGKNLVYTSANGHMFSQMNKAGELGVRLPKDRQQAMGEEHGAGPFKSYGATMRDYICFTDEMLMDEARVAALLKEGLAFVESLPPGNKK